MWWRCLTKNWTSAIRMAAPLAIMERSGSLRTASIFAKSFYLSFSRSSLGLQSFGLSWRTSRRSEGMRPPDYPLELLSGKVILPGTTWVGICTMLKRYWFESFLSCSMSCSVKPSIYGISSTSSSVHNLFQLAWILSLISCRTSGCITSHSSKSRCASP